MKRTNLIAAAMVAAMFLAVAYTAAAHQTSRRGWNHYGKDQQRKHHVHHPQKHRREKKQEPEEIPFDVAEIFFELNDTDGDLGLHALIDGDPWKSLEIEGPDGSDLLNLRLRRALAEQGLTEFFFESAEPNFDELDPADFFARFPAGEYEVEAVTIEGEELESETELSHVIPAPAGGLTVGGEPALAPEGEECEEEELPEIVPPVTVAWDAVRSSHPELGVEGEVEVIRYRVVAEYEDEDENVFVTNIDVPPDDEIDRYEVEIPEQFFREDTEVKFELLVRDASFNQTAVESCPFEAELD